MADATNRNVILLHGTPTFKEKTAIAALTPGMLLDNAGTSPNATAADVDAAPIFVQDSPFGGNTIDTVVPIGEVFTSMTLMQGNRVSAISSGAVVADTYVESAGDGKLKTRTTGRANLMARSAAAGSDERIIVEAV